MFGVATSPAGCSASQPYTSVGPTPEEIQQQIQQQVQQQVAAQRAVYEQQAAEQRAVYEQLLKESQEKFREDMQSQMATMMNFFSRSTRSPPGSGS